MLIDAARADSLYAAMAAGVEASGGSAGNTVAGVASLGGRAAYVGKVADDALGEVFAHDIAAVGVHFAPTPLKGGEGTGPLPGQRHPRRPTHHVHLSPAPPTHWRPKMSTRR